MEITNFLEIYQQFSPLVLKMYWSFSAKIIEQEDFEQEAKIVLWKTIKAYQKDSRWTLGVSFKNNLRRWMCSNYRKSTAKKRTLANNQYNCINDSVNVDTIMSLNSEKLEDAIIMKLYFNDFFLFFIKTQLNKTNRAIFLQEIGIFSKDNQFNLAKLKKRKRSYQRSKRKFVSIYNTLSKK